MKIHWPLIDLVITESAALFLAKFVFYKFFNNFSYGNFKKFLKIFKLYILKYSKIYTLQKIFLQLL